MSSDKKSLNLFQATLFKEWIKLRLYWALMVIGSTVFAVYLSLRLRHTHAFNDAVAIWNAWIYKGYLFFDSFQYVPLGAGIVLALLQFLPETLNKRIRLVLHLPLGEERVVSHHLLTGILGLTWIIIPALFVFAVTGWIYFPREFQQNLYLTAFPWFLAGYAGYLLTAALLLEDRWKHRVFYLLFASATLRLLFLGEFYDVYLRLIPGLIVWTVLLFLTPLFSNYRFRKGLES
jgi:hypothetical protein